MKVTGLAGGRSELRRRYSLDRPPAELLAFDKIIRLRLQASDYSTKHRAVFYAARRLLMVGG